MGKAEDNDVKINTKTPVQNYIRYVLSLFNERNFKEVKLSAMGSGINKVATIAEIVKHRVKGLHQLNEIKT